MIYTLFGSKVEILAFDQATQEASVLRRGDDDDKIVRIHRRYLTDGSNGAELAVVLEKLGGAPVV